MYLAERRTFYCIMYCIVLELLKTYDFVTFCLAYPFMSGDAIGAEVFHTVDTPGVGQFPVLTIGARGWVLYGEDIQHIISKRMGWHRVHTLYWNWEIDAAY